MTSPSPDAPVPGEGPPAGQVSAVGGQVFRTALRFMVRLLSGLLVVGVPVGALVDGWRGVWAALLGVALALVFSGTTVVSVMRTVDDGPIRMVTVVLGAWVAKIAVVFVSLIVLSQFDFYNRLVLIAVMLAGVIGSALLDYRAVTSARMPYVDPPRDEGHIPGAGA